jgi:asparagine synthase (glutamine-hydrolysing)
VCALTLGGYTSNQLLRDIDATSMAHSLEVRVPLLDPIVADVALALPDSAKLNGPDVLARYPTGTYRQTGAKRTLIDIGRPMLPPDLDNQPKRGFVMPFDAWLKGPLREALLDTLASESVRGRGLLDPNAVELVAADFFAGRGYWAQPWLIMIFELWCREMIDGRTSQPS